MLMLYISTYGGICGDLNEPNIQIIPYSIIVTILINTKKA